MPTASPSKFSASQQQRFGFSFLSHDHIRVGSLLCKILVILGLVFFFLSLLKYHPNCHSEILSPLQSIWVSPPQQPPPRPRPRPPPPPPRDHHLGFHQDDDSPPTNITHIVFGLVGSIKGWRHRRPFIESWWKHNITRGYIYFDEPPPKDLLPWPISSPPFRVSEDNSKLLQITKHDATMVRIARGLLETFREGDEGVRWIVMGDDDSIFFLENMVEVLRNYDHTKYVYIGGHSESILPNFIHSFDMGFGGAGVVFSYGLAAALVPRLDDCIKRYPQIYAADQMWQSCLADLGVYLSHERGIHQIDLLGDISGLLSAHPQSPLISLHHPEKVHPIFPKLSRRKSVNHLMKAARVDQSRLLQQTICYHREKNWSISVSWGYSAQIYESVFPKSILQKPIETFRPWVENVPPPLFTFNTRLPSIDGCQAPHIFFFESIEKAHQNQILTTYARSAPRGLPPCGLTGNHSADLISQVRVFSSAEKLPESKIRECCDILHVDGKKIAVIKYRTCAKDEVIA